MSRLEKYIIQALKERYEYKYKPGTYEGYTKEELEELIDQDLKEIAYTLINYNEIDSLVRDYITIRDAGRNE